MANVIVYLYGEQGLVCAYDQFSAADAVADISLPAGTDYWVTTTALVIDSSSAGIILLIGTLGAATGTTPGVQPSAPELTYDELESYLESLFETEIYVAITNGDGGDISTDADVIEKLTQLFTLYAHTVIPAVDITKLEGSDGTFHDMNEARITNSMNDFFTNWRIKENIRAGYVIAIRADSYSSYAALDALTW